MSHEAPQALPESPESQPAIPTPTRPFGAAGGQDIRDRWQKIPYSGLGDIRADTQSGDIKGMRWGKHSWGPFGLGNRELTRGSQQGDPAYVSQKTTSKESDGEHGEVTKALRQEFMDQATAYDPHRLLARQVMAAGRIKSKRAQKRIEQANEDFWDWRSNGEWGDFPVIRPRNPILRGIKRAAAHQRQKLEQERLLFGDDQVAERVVSVTREQDARANSRREFRRNLRAAKRQVRSAEPGSDERREAIARLNRLAAEQRRIAQLQAEIKRQQKRGQVKPPKRTGRHRG